VLVLVSARSGRTLYCAYRPRLQVASLALCAEALCKRRRALEGGRADTSSRPEGSARARQEIDECLGIVRAQSDTGGNDARQAASNGEMPDRVCTSAVET
jgi:hypothetical protein